MRQTEYRRMLLNLQIIRRIRTGKPWLNIRRQHAYAHLLSAYCGQRPWKAIGDRLRRAYCLSSVDHVRKIMDRKQRMDMGKYSCVNRTIKNWNQLAAVALGASPCKSNIFRNRVRKVSIITNSCTHSSIFIKKTLNTCRPRWE